MPPYPPYASLVHQRTLVYYDGEQVGLYADADGNLWIGFWTDRHTVTSFHEAASFDHPGEPAGAGPGEYEVWSFFPAPSPLGDVEEEGNVDRLCQLRREAPRHLIVFLNERNECVHERTADWAELVRLGYA